MTKEYSGNYYKVVAFDDSHGLSTRRTDDFDELVTEINEIVDRARERGYKGDEKWLIVSVEWGKEYEENGDARIFVSAWEKSRTVAEYINGVVTEW